MHSPFFPLVCSMEFVVCRRWFKTFAIRTNYKLQTKNYLLFKVFYARFEDRLEFVASDVLEDVFGAEAFGMRHLAEDTAIGAGNAFDCQD